jgi:monoamine oxidase
MQLAVYAERHKLSTSEVLERAEEAQARIAQQNAQQSAHQNTQKPPNQPHKGMSRRTFLRSAAALGVGAAFSPAFGTSLVRAQASPRVVIVGAGIAGLACAYRLEQAGITPRIIEANNRVGGRMFSLTNAFPDGQKVELGGEFIDTGHESLLGFAEEFGLNLIDLPASTEGLDSDTFFIDGKEVLIRRVISEFRPVASAMQAVFDNLTGDLTYSNPGNARRIDRMSIAEWFDENDIQGNIRAILTAAYTGEFVQEIDRQSAWNFLFMEPFTTEDAISLFGISDERYTIAEGNEAIPAALANELDAEILTGTVLRELRELANGTYLLTVESGGSTRSITADSVVLTIPFTALRDVDLKLELPPAKKRAINSLQLGAGGKLMMRFRTRVWRAARSSGSVFTDLPFQATWDTSRGQPGRHGIITNFYTADHALEVGELNRSAHVRQFLSQFDQVFPDVSTAYTGQAVRQDWTKAPFIGGAYSYYQPGQYTSFRGAEGEPVGGVFFAGEHTSLDYQGYMNGGSETGERAAAEVLSYLGM